MITILGNPLGKQRARTLKSGRSYTPEQTVNYENFVKMCYIEQKGEFFGDKPLRMEITAYYPIPKSTSKKKISMMLTGEIRPTKKPDLTNVIKSIEDGLNGIAYKDDSQIVTLITLKKYGLEPRVELGIYGVYEF
jgi:Holliday junction resolvase RusA-like endonuclease